jgi:hypothetical protein
MLLENDGITVAGQPVNVPQVVEAVRLPSASFIVLGRIDERESESNREGELTTI